MDTDKAAQRLSFLGFRGGVDLLAASDTPTGSCRIGITLTGRPVRRH
ncbi:MAG: hypothetical protein RIB65_09870 [Ilumatobacter fluminis]